MSFSTIDQILELTAQLSPEERQILKERLAPVLESEPAAAARTDLDEQYQRGYENIPESTEDLEALLPHLPLSSEQWK